VLGIIEAVGVVLTLVVAVRDEIMDEEKLKKELDKLVEKLKNKNTRRKRGGVRRSRPSKTIGIGLEKTRPSSYGKRIG